MKVQLTQVVETYSEHPIEVFPRDVSAVHQINEKSYCIVIIKGTRYLVKGTQEEIMEKLK